jgi:hypothetical protein
MLVEIRGLLVPIAIVMAGKSIDMHRGLRFDVAGFNFVAALSP